MISAERTKKDEGVADEQKHKTKYGNTMPGLKEREKRKRSATQEKGKRRERL